MQTRRKPAGAPVAVLLPGTASTADFATRALGPALAAVGVAVVCADPPLGRDVAAGQLAQLDAATQEHDVVLVGGVSMGAHLATRWAAGRDDLAGVLAVLPAWTGAPGAVAAAGAVAAEAVRTDGPQRVLAGLDGAGPGWVRDELARAWSGRPQVALADTLVAAATERGPTAAELADLRCPLGIAAVRGDPLHPAAVAADWAGSAPASAVVELDHAAVAGDRAALGRAVVLAWLRAGGTLSGAR